MSNVQTRNKTLKLTVLPHAEARNRQSCLKRRPREVHKIRGLGKYEL